MTGRSRSQSTSLHPSKSRTAIFIAIAPHPRLMARWGLAGAPGPHARRPVPRGVAWWATDQGSWNTSTTESHSDSPGEDGVLDKCTATNTWTNGYYTPPRYPHPLVTGGSIPTTPPAPASPTNVRIIR